MIRLIFLLFLMIITSGILNAGTCTSISRSDFVDGNILSASDLNSQFGTAYSAINASDGGCITDGTLELSALNTTEFGPQLNGVKRGCEVTNTATNSFSINSCFATVNSLSVSTATGTEVTYDDLDTGSMATATSYYIYIADGSTGSTLTPKISATGPNGKGYNTNNDLVLARFRTSTDSTNYRADSIYQWSNGGYNNSRVVNEIFYIRDNGDLFTSFDLGTKGGLVTSATRTATGSYTITTDSNYSEEFSCLGSGAPNPTGLDAPIDVIVFSGGSVYQAYDLSDGALADAMIKLHCIVKLKD